MNKPRYLLDGEPVSALGLIALAAGVTTFKTPAARTLIQAAIGVLKDKTRTIAGRKWNADWDCFADELEKVDV